MEQVHDRRGARLTQAQREVLLGWVAAGITDYRAIKKLLIKHGFPIIQRQNLDYYRRRYGRSPRCAACGREFPPVAPTSDAGAVHLDVVGRKDSISQRGESR